VWPCAKLGTGLIPTHTYSWLVTPLAWYRVENHTHNYMTNHSSGLVQCRYPQAHIYMTTHSTGSIPTPTYIHSQRSD
jgi:hypothetical protein